MINHNNGLINLNGKIKKMKFYNNKENSILIKNRLMYFLKIQIFKILKNLIKIKKSPKILFREILLFNNKLIESF